MKKKILLVDDKATIGKVAGIYLGKDYDFTYLEDPIKAIEWLNEGNVPDLIISDIRMPLMTGDEFLRYMKKNELFKSIPIVMLSSEESTTERIRLLEEGAEDYTGKNAILKLRTPVDNSELYYPGSFVSYNINSSYTQARQSTGMLHEKLRGGISYETQNHIL